MKNFLKKDITLHTIAIFIIIVVIATIFSYSQPLTYTMTVSDKPTVNEPVNVNFEIEKRMAHYSPESFEVELTHKYNSNETYNFTLDPYDQGYYEFIFTPKYSGPYLIKLTLELDNNTQYITDTIEID